MANRIRSEQFLPEILQTPANKQLLRSTLDQLTQNPKLKPTEGYIGRKIGPGVTASDSYVLEPTQIRTDYQLEPGVVQTKDKSSELVNTITYPGMIDSLNLQGANTTRNDRLFDSEYYSFDPFVDFDKYVNFGQYYWVPAGPDSVSVFANAIPIRATYDVKYVNTGFTFSTLQGTLPTISLARQGEYKFDVTDLGRNFWIQSQPGTSGVLRQQPNQSSRDVLGVVNNGDDVGTITFSVPSKTAQNFFFTLADIGSTDLLEDTLQFNQINGQFVDVFNDANGGIDGITDLDGRTLIITTDTDVGWEVLTPFDDTLFDQDNPGIPNAGFDNSVALATDPERYVQWRINYNYANPLRPFIELTKVQDVANLSKSLINYGTDYAGVTFYKNADGLFERQPLITANLDFLYYQDQSDALNFGIIRLVDQENISDLNVDADIVGKKNFTSPNGVVFTNGLKVEFTGAIVPSSYEGNQYYVEGVGTAIELLPVTNFVTPETYTVSAGVPFDSIPFDVGGFDATANAPKSQDYMTINRASLDINAWTRGNRWFHIDVLTQTANYNNVSLVIDNGARAKRPILEYRKSLKLFNYGIQATAPIDIIDFSQQNAFQNVNGSIGYSVDGYNLIEGSRIIFAADLDPQVANKIYTVNFVDFEDSSVKTIDLQAASLTSPEEPVNTNVVVLSGTTEQGKSYWFNGTTWLAGQQKTDVNQPPLFDVYDANGYSLSDTTVYPSTTFVGTKLFSYAVGTGVTDSVIDQPLKYLTISNVGDIVFDNNLYIDKFTYVSGTTSSTQNIDTGIIRQYNTITSFNKLLGWQTHFDTNVQRQSFTFDYAGSSLVLDIPVITDTSKIPVKVFVEGQFVLPSTYTYITNADNVTVVTFNTNIVGQPATQPAIGAVVEVQVISESASTIGFYTIPSNLESNAMNKNSNGFTLGTVRTHYETICQNLESFSGKIHGANNVRDLGNIIPFGNLILQQSAPLTMVTPFITGREFEFFRALEFNSQEYSKTKNKILDFVSNNDWEGKTTATILDTTLLSINAGKNADAPFYWTDALPSGNDFETTTYTFSPISTYVFDTLYSYNFTSANYQGILVYLTPKATGVQTILVGDGEQYTVATDGPRITINNDKVTLANDDIITIREYTFTYGSYVPATPSMMGMYPVYLPYSFLDNTYQTPTTVIQGHDGSLTVAFPTGDYRNDVLLEFEKRVYNNIKINTYEKYDPPLRASDVIPGQFRTTAYTLTEINDILNVSFLAWVGANRVPYKDQTYDANDQFTWNYSASENRLDGDPLLGFWRGIYFDLYDTDSPHTRPWEMVGLSIEPSWWTIRYGPAPYTSGNTVLWDDLSKGIISYPTGNVIVKEFIRPGLLDCLPTDSQGNLVSPMQSIVGSYDQNSFVRSWVAGDYAPTQTAWRRSSYYPFAIQRLLALTESAKFFSLFSDRDLYKYNTDYNQYLFNDRFRIDPAQLTIYGNGTSKNSYINYVVDYNRVTGLDSTVAVKQRLSNLDIRLCYRMACFSDKSYLKIFSEKSSPNSLNSSLLLPDESYQLFLYSNPSFAEIHYSAVTVQRTSTGYAVAGYSTTKPYFEILQSQPTGKFTTINVNGQTSRINNSYTQNVIQVPYGYVFTSSNAVVDFLNSYGAFLDKQGLTFNSQINDTIVNWKQMSEEFLYWVGQSWTVGSLINLNPGADVLKIEKPFSVVESLQNENINDIMLDQNFEPLFGKDYAVERLDNELKLVGLNNQTFSFLNARFTSYEHIIVFDNTSIFNDLIYNPTTGARQNRLLLNGNTVFDWNGTLDAQGFILNQNNIEEWVANVAYTKGQIVLYKEAYWSATRLLAPSETFVFADWIKSDFDRIQTGLLPNLATKADALRENYDIHTANLESDATLLGLGLIGFRPRQYMQNLNLDDISQAGLYSQFLGTKGTLGAAEQFKSANLGKEEAEYEIRENWAIQRGIYGANANRSYFELRLDESKLLGNPSTVAVVDPGDITTANQQILVDNIWKQSYKITNKNILPTVGTIPDDIALPTAGYVNFDDVDIKVFNFDDLSNIVANLDQIAIGTNIWVAKANPYDWNIYRNNLVNATITTVVDNLNGTSTLTFNTNHGLLIGSRIVIKYFDASVDGAYTIASVPSLQTITIALSLPGEVTSVTGIGLVFILETVRVAQASDVAGLSFANNIVSGNQAWVDDYGDGKWAVLQKINPFGSPTEIDADTPILNDLFGTSVEQGLIGQGLAIGAPGYASGKGGIYCYNKSDTNTYKENTIMTPTAAGFVGTGTSLSVGNTERLVAGAPASDSSKGYAVGIRRNSSNGEYTQTQLFNTGTNDVDNFGRDIAVSDDERWLYISAPTATTSGDYVWAYQQVGVQSQTLNFTGDGTTRDFIITGTIVVSAVNATAQTQLGVTRNNISQTAGSGYTVQTSGTNQVVRFATAPNENDTIRITRLQGVTYLPTVSTTAFSTATVHSVTDIYSFSVYYNGSLLRPIFDYTFAGDTVTLLVAISSGNLLIDAKTYWDFVKTIKTGGSVGDLPGQSISTTTDGRHVIIGAPGAEVTVGSTTTTDAGKVYIYDRSVERFQVTTASTTTQNFTTVDTPEGTPAVTVNGTYLIPTAQNNNAEFSFSGTTTTIGTATNPYTLNIGDIVEIETNNFRLVQTINSSTVGTNYKFGQAVDMCSTNCSLYISEPNDSTISPEGGSVDRWINQSRLFGTITGTVTNPVLTATDSIRINNYYVTLSGTTVASLVTDITTADLPNIKATEVSGALQITLVDIQAGEAFIKLQVAPGLGTAFADLGLAPIVFAQTIIAPIPQEYGHFGQTIKIDSTATTLVVGAPDATANLPTTFDSGTTGLPTTYFDSRSTQLIDPLDESGVVYTYNYLSSANASATNPGKFAFGQQIYDTSMVSFDKFGSAVDFFDGVLLVGAPNDDLNDSSGDYGRVTQLVNANKESAWKIVYNEQPMVDSRLLNSVFTYSKVNNEVDTYLDFIDPLQGKILGAASANINYQGGIDPAAYNTGTVNNFGSQWRDEHLGEFWWDLSTVRFIDYHQDTIEYKARRWGQLFPGSSVDVYQWTKNTVAPSAYVGEGTVYTEDSYVVTSELDSAGTFVTNYYYWVKGLTIVPGNKTLSSNAITQYITDPRSSGVSYSAALSQSTIGLYNVRTQLVATDTILHVEFDKLQNTDAVHSEYDLITQNDPNSFLGTGLYRKFLDSYCGVDTLGNNVPDPTLSPADKYGPYFRPRQSFFINRFLALENYLKRANRIMKLYPITDNKTFKLLNSEDPEPTSASGLWDKRLLTYAELTYQDLRQVAVGYNYLVASDSTQEGLWTIYTVLAGPKLQLARVQNYDTKLYWSYVDWNGINADKSTYSNANASTYEVAVYSNLLALENVLDGEWATVLANSFAKKEVYQYSTTTGEWTRVFLEDGTIAIDETIWDYTVGNFGWDVEVFDAQRFAQAPDVETRQILKALNEEIFTNELKIFRNELLILTFEFIMSEQSAPDWLIKTSLIDVNHKIRDLIEYPIFRRDNQDFVSQYIQEVKPYHVQVREFNLRYEGEDTYNGSLTDFDLPAYYDAKLNQFVSPILDDTEFPKSLSAVPSTSSIWATFPWSQWYNNYKLAIKSVTVLQGGSGYTVPPQVVVTGDAITQATFTATVNTAGVLTGITVVTTGSGYSTTPTLTISGGNGTGGTAVVVLEPQQVRDFTTTVKYDRITYTSQVKDWTASTVYTAGQLIRYPVPTLGVVNVSLPQVYTVNTNFTSGTIFDPENYTKVDQSTLDGADRTIGLYTPEPNEPGRELAQVMTGIDYPGVQVDAPDFNENTGFDIGNFDTTPFDNIDFGPEGLPTYDPAILDVIYESSFTDTYLGTRSTDINIVGGAFIDTYSSHAPEELVPGSEFDTLDLKVFTRPGSDWNADGHGFGIATINVVFAGAGTTLDFTSAILHPVGIEVIDITSGQSIVNTAYTINWVTKVVTLGASMPSGVGDNIGVRVYGLGGGSQIYKESIVGTEIVDNVATIPVVFTQINQMVIFVNGIVITDYAFAADTTGFKTDVTFTSTYGASDWITFGVLGTTTPTQYSWSTPLVQYMTYDGSSLLDQLTNSLGGTNGANLIVQREGLRLRPPEGIEYTGDGSSAGPYYISTTGISNQALVSPADMLVYVDNVKQALAVDYNLSAWDGSSNRYIEFTTGGMPPANSDIKIFTTTEADYILLGDQIDLRVSAAANAQFAVYTFNDTAQQNLLTKVFVGPTTTGVTTGDGYDEVPYDSAAFDRTIGTTIDTNNFALGRLVTSPERLIVTLNGLYISTAEYDLTTNASNLTTLVLDRNVINAADVLVVTMFTNTVVPNSLNFRIFQDMLGNQKLLRLNTKNTTQLTKELAVDDVEIHVLDASKLSEPNLENNIFGQLTVGAERITYRVRDVPNNTVSDLRRGTAGTGVYVHAKGDSVSDVGPGEQLPATYQQKTTTDKTNYGDGTTTRFTTSIIVPTGLDSTELSESITVTVAGTVLVPETDYTITGTDTTFTEVTLTTAPAVNVEVWFSQVTANVMYAQGTNTASNGIALQDQTTPAVLFLKS
jgi:hypothetical protein